MFSGSLEQRIAAFFAKLGSADSSAPKGVSVFSEPAARVALVEAKLEVAESVDMCREAGWEFSEVLRNLERGHQAVVVASDNDALEKQTADLVVEAQSIKTAMGKEIEAKTPRTQDGSHPGGLY